MKHFLTASAMLFSFLAAAQFPNLPYNPDENGDGLIGVVDLQGLLANYGNEFAGAVLSENGESAIVYMGEMQYPHCEYACEQLPGYWSMPELKDLVPVWGEVYNNTNPQTWLKPQENMLDLTGAKERLFPYFQGYSNNGSRGVYASDVGFNINDYRCYCTAKQLPRVEYTACEGCNYSGNGAYTVLNLQSCIDEKLAEGWYPLGNAAQTGYGGGCTNQAFWRWAE